MGAQAAAANVVLMGTMDGKPAATAEAK